MDNRYESSLILMAIYVIYMICEFSLKQEFNSFALYMSGVCLVMTLSIYLRDKVFSKSVGF